MNTISKDSLTRGESAVYPIKGDDVDWHAGIISSGEQILVVLFFPTILALRFSANGELVGLMSVSGFPSQSIGVFSQQDDERLQDWLKDIGFRPSLIRIKRFFLPEYNIGISDLSQMFKKYLLHPNQFDRDEVDFAERESQRWSAKGLFELWLNEWTDVWIDGMGEIVAT